MPQILTYSQIVLSILLIILILLQQKGSGLSSAFGGSSMEYSTKRGAEKIIFYSTIIVSALFISVSVIRLVL